MNPKNKKPTIHKPTPVKPKKATESTVAMKANHKPQSKKEENNGLATKVGLGVGGVVLLGLGGLGISHVLHGENRSTQQVSKSNANNSSDSSSLDIKSSKDKKHKKKDASKQNSAENNLNSILNSSSGSSSKGSSKSVASGSHGNTSNLNNLFDGTAGGSGDGNSLAKLASEAQTSAKIADSLGTILNGGGHIGTPEHPSMQVIDHKIKGGETPAPVANAEPSALGIINNINGSHTAINGSHTANNDSHTAINGNGESGEGLHGESTGSHANTRDNNGSNHNSGSHSGNHNKASVHETGHLTANSTIYVTGVAHNGEIQKYIKDFKFDDNTKSVDHVGEVQFVGNNGLVTEHITLIGKNGKKYEVTRTIDVDDSAPSYDGDANTRAKYHVTLADANVKVGDFYCPAQPEIQVGNKPIGKQKSGVRISQAGDHTASFRIGDVDFTQRVYGYDDKTNTADTNSTAQSNTQTESNEAKPTTTSVEITDEPAKTGASSSTSATNGTRRMVNRSYSSHSHNHVPGKRLVMRPEVHDNVMPSN